MVIDALRLAERVHGHVGWLAAAALAHPAILLRDRQRRVDLSVASSAALVTIAALAGAWLYGPYTDRIKQQTFLHAPSIGVLFERKEHLAFAAVVLTWAGVCAYVAARRLAPGANDGLRDTLRVVAFRAYVGATALTTVAAVMGTIVAAYKSF